MDFVNDGSGFPILRLSSLAVPIRNVLENPKCSVVVQMPGWSGLANAQVTIFGDIYQLPLRLEDFAKQVDFFNLVSLLFCVSCFMIGTPRGMRSCLEIHCISGCMRLKISSLWVDSGLFNGSMSGSTEMPNLMRSSLLVLQLIFKYTFDCLINTFS